MTDQDPAEHMVVISKGEGDGRIERKLKNEFVKFQFSFFFSKLNNELKNKKNSIFISFFENLKQEIEKSSHLYKKNET